MKKASFYIILALFLVAVIGIFILASISESQSVLGTITPTDAACEAYRSGGALLTAEDGQGLSYDGYMRCYAIVYIPDAHELQITVKSNKSTYERLGTTEEAGFDFMLYDTVTEEENRNYTEERASEGRHCYYRLVFSDFELTEETDVELIMFPKGKDDKYSYLKFHRAGEELTEYELSDEEVAALGGKN